jgi:hypothetical protein
LAPRPPTRRPRGGDVDAPDAPVVARELAGIEETRRVFAAWAPALFSFPFFFFFVCFSGERATNVSRGFRVRSFRGRTPFVSRRLYAEATGTARSEAGAAKTLEASLYRRRDDERILLVDVGNAFDFLHPRARASKAASRRRASSREDTSFTRTDPHSTPMTGS